MYPNMNVDNAASFAGKAATQKTKAVLGAAKFGGDQTDLDYDPMPYGAKRYYPPPYGC